MAGDALAAFLGALLGAQLVGRVEVITREREVVRAAPGEAAAERVLIPVPQNGRLVLRRLLDLQVIAQRAAEEILSEISRVGERLEKAIRESALKLETKSYDLYEPRQIRSATTVSPEEENWLDIRKKRPQAPLILWCVNTHDQALSVQVVGNVAKSPNQMVPLGAAQTIDANGGVLSIFIDDSYWHPYISLQISAGAPPTTGDFRAKGFWQE